MEPLPDGALVVRGGQNLPENFVKGSGVTIGEDGLLLGVSVNSSTDSTVEELTAVIPRPRVYADFHNLDDSNRLRLTCVGTIDDLARQGIELREGLVLTFSMDDADDQGEPDEFLGNGVVHYDENERSWVASIEWSTIRHASDERKPGAGSPSFSDQVPTGEAGLTHRCSGPPSAAAELER